MFCRNLRLIQRFVRSESTLFYSNSKQEIAVEKLPERCLIRVAGNNIDEYLQGLITNDVNHFKNGASCIYAMFLNTRGRILFDSLLYKIDEDDVRIIECDTSVVPELSRHLNMYKVRRKISINSQQNDIAIWNLAYKHQGLSSPEEYDYKSLLASVNSVEGVLKFRDPRVPSLGIRCIVPSEIDFVKELQALIPNVSVGSQYKYLRYQIGVAEGSKELPIGTAFPLEANCDYMHGVSFHKGCYIGQELTARTHHTGVVRKRIMPIDFEKDAESLPFDTSVTGDGQEKSLGKVRGSIDNVGIGLLRIEEVLSAKYLEAGGIAIKTHRPSWWPTEAPRDRSKSS